MAADAVPNAAPSLDVGAEEAVEPLPPLGDAETDPEVLPLPVWVALGERETDARGEAEGRGEVLLEA